MDSETLHAEIRRITEETRRLRQELEQLFRNRTRETRAFSHEPAPRAVAADRPSLARRIGPKVESALPRSSRRRGR